MNRTNFSIDNILLKQENFCFDSPICFKIQKTRQSKSPKILQSNAAFSSNQRGVLVTVLLSTFSYWKLNFYVCLFSLKTQKIRKPRPKITSNHPVKRRKFLRIKEKSFPIAGVICAIDVNVRVR